MQLSIYHMPPTLHLDEAYSLAGNLCIFLIAYSLINRWKKTSPPRGSEPELRGRDWTNHARSVADSILLLVPFALVFILWARLLRLYLTDPGVVGICDIVVLFGIWAGNNYLLADVISSPSDNDSGSIPLFSALSATLAVVWYLSSSLEGPGSAWVSCILNAAAGIALSWSALPSESTEGKSFRWALFESVSAQFVIFSIASLRFFAGPQIDSFLAQNAITIKAVSHGQAFTLSWLGNRVEEVLYWALYAYVVFSTWIKLLVQIKNFDDQRADTCYSKSSGRTKMFTATFGVGVVASSGMMLALPEPSHVLVWLSAGGFAMLGCVAVFCRSGAVRQALWAHEYRSAEPSLLLSSPSMKHPQDHKGRLVCEIGDNEKLSGLSLPSPVMS